MNCEQTFGGHEWVRGVCVKCGALKEPEESGGIEFAKVADVGEDAKLEAKRYTIPIAIGGPEPRKPDTADVIYTAQEAMPIIITMICRPCQTAMECVRVGQSDTGTQVFQHRCPTCKSEMLAAEQFPVQKWQPKPNIQQAHNFINPNKGPRGRRH